MAKDSERPDADAATDLLDPTDDVGSDEPTAAGPKSTLRLRLVAAVGVLLLVVSTASAVFFYLQLDDEQAVDDAQSAARTAACDYARDLANFDFNDLDPYFGSVLDGATGEWKTQFDARRDDLRTLYTQGQVVSQVTEVQCAVVSGDANTAEALVVVTESVASVATQGQPQLGQLTVKATLDKTDGRWLVSKLSAPQLV